MKPSHLNPNRFNHIWGNQMLCSLPAISRRRRKRDASKVRRRLMRAEVSSQLADREMK